MQSLFNDLLAERDRLQAVIDEANGQEPVGIVEIWNQGGSGQFSTLSGIHKIAHGTRLYAKPIPAHHITDSGKMIDQSEDNLEMVDPMRGFNRDSDDALDKTISVYSANPVLNEVKE